MVFKSMDEFRLWLSLCEKAYLSEGGQGRCYKIGNKVYKIFLQYLEKCYEDIIIPYYKEDILRFSGVTNNTYVFPNDVIMVGNTVVGYIMDYIDAKSLYKTDPFSVDLDFFEESINASLNDIEIISNNGVLSFDVMYNMMFGKEGISVIDTLDYSMTDIDPDKLFVMNYDRFCHEIKLFLVYGYFDNVVENNKILNEMYIDKESSIVLFLKEFRKYLSEIEGYEIKKLSDVKKSKVVRRRKYHAYIREI